MVADAMDFFGQFRSLGCSSLDRLRNGHWKYQRDLLKLYTEACQDPWSISCTSLLIADLLQE